MQAEIKGGSAFSYVEIDLDPGESVITEADAMSSMDARLELKAILNGGFWRALLRKFLGGETFFVSRFSNQTDSKARLTIVQPTPGEVTAPVTASQLASSRDRICASSISAKELCDWTTCRTKRSRIA